MAIYFKAFQGFKKLSFLDEVNENSKLHRSLLMSH